MYRHICSKRSYEIVNHNLLGAVQIVYQHHTAGTVAIAE
jgi:hypothetical protein